jgi:hypothetical protein
VESSGLPVADVVSALDDGSLAVAPDRVVELAGARRRSGRPTVFDVGARDVEATGDGIVLTPGAHDLVTACGLATSPGGALHRAASAASRALVVPTMLSRSRHAALRHATGTTSSRVVTWYATPGGDGAASEGVAKVLAERSDVRLDVVGDPSDLPVALRGHAHVRAVHVADPETVAGSAAHVWTPELLDGELVDGVVPLLDAASAAVPSVMSASARAFLDGWVSHEVVVEHADDPAEWAAILLALLDDDRKRAYQGGEARRRANSLSSPGACNASVERFLGWIARVREA